MGVQDVVARLNKSKSEKVPPVPFLPKQKRTIMQVDNSNKILPPSPVTSPTTSKHPMNNLKDNNVSNILQKFNNNNTSNKPVNVTQKVIDYRHFDELEDLFSNILDQNKASEEYMEQLQKDVEKYKSDSTKVRDYEIRVEYLALKLEQVSEERDLLEKELDELKLVPPQQTISEPLSPAYTYQQQQQSDIVIEEEQKLHNENNDAYMADILNVYEEISNKEEEDYDIMSQQLSIQQQEQQQGMQMAIVKYITDLEQQKLETKRLKEVIKKQDQLISTLELKKNDDLLKEQVELQKIELDNKRELLTQLLNEREDLLNRLSNNRNSFRRSSIDSLKRLSIRSITPPPLTCPPKQPLPPLP